MNNWSFERTINLITQTNGCDFNYFFLLSETQIIVQRAVYHIRVYSLTLLHTHCILYDVIWSPKRVLVFFMENAEFRSRRW